MDSLGDWRVVLAILALALVGFIAALPVLVRPLFRLALAPHYKIRVRGRENLPKTGPALLTVNHVTWIDGFILVAACPLRGRALISASYVNFPGLRWLARWVGLISVPVSGPRGQRAAITAVREALDRGEAVGIFPEGQLTRTGLTGPFYRGLEVMIAGREHVPVIPVYLDNLWGSIFSFKGGRFVWKWPTRLPYPVTVTFGPPLPGSVTAAEARQAVMSLGTDALSHRFGAHDVLHERFLRTAKRRWRALAMADATGLELTYGRTLIGALLLAGWLRGTRRGEPMVGLMLPASVGGALVNLAALLAGTVPVNLNFTAGRDTVEAALAQCGIRTVVTSRAFLAKARLEPVPGTVFLEDVLASFTTARKAWTALLARVLPVPLLRRLWGGERAGIDDLATVIFSSGSTGHPKGVMLSHRNVLAVIEGMEQVFSVTPQDRIVGVLPFFHSFGFTGTLWFPLVSGFARASQPQQPLAQQTRLNPADLQFLAGPELDEIAAARHQVHLRDEIQGGEGPSPQAHELRRIQPGLQILQPVRDRVPVATHGGDVQQFAFRGDEGNLPDREERHFRAVPYRDALQQRQARVTLVLRGRGREARGIGVPELAPLQPLARAVERVGKP